MTAPIEPKGVIVILAAAADSTGAMVAQTVLFPRGHAWEYNDQRVTVKNTNNDVIGEFRNGSYLGIGFRDELRVNKLTQPTGGTN